MFDGSSETLYGPKWVDSSSDMRGLVFQHIDVEHPGIFNEFFARSGMYYTTVRLNEREPIPAPDTFDFLMVLGGPMDVWEEDQFPWLKAEKAAIRHWVQDLQRPFIGVCLGHQLLADALGGMVAKMQSPEVGILLSTCTEPAKDDPLFRNLFPRYSTLQWHGAEVTHPPQGATVLAKSALCNVQAFRIGSRAYGIQGHVEVTGDTAHEWGEVPAYREALAKLNGPDGQRKLEAEVSEMLPQLRSSAENVFLGLKELLRVAR